MPASGAPRPRGAAGPPARPSTGGGGLPRFGHEVRREAAQLTPRQARPYEHPVGAVDALLDRRAERVELGEAASLVVREQELHALEPIREALGDPRLELVEPFAGQ